MYVCYVYEFGTYVLFVQLWRYCKTYQHFKCNICAHFFISSGVHVSMYVCAFAKKLLLIHFANVLRVVLAYHQPTNEPIYSILLESIAPPQKYVARFCCQCHLHSHRHRHRHGQHIFTSCLLPATWPAGAHKQRPNWKLNDELAFLVRTFRYTSPFSACLRCLLQAPCSTSVHSYRSTLSGRRFLFYGRLLSSL